MGAYRYHVLLFGLTNACPNYQHYMNDVLFAYLDESCAVYRDDILICSKAYKQHVKHVRKFLQNLIDAGLQVDIERCEFDV